MLNTRRLAAIAAALALSASISTAQADAPSASGLRWAPSLRVATERAERRLIPMLVVIDDVGPSRRASLFRDDAVVDAASRFVCARAEIDAVRRLLPLAEVVSGTRYVAVSPTGRILAQLTAPDADETIAPDLREIWLEYRDQLAGRLAGSLKSRNTARRDAALRDTLIFLESDPTNRALRTAVERFSTRLKRDEDRLRTWNVVVDVDNEAALRMVAPALNSKSPHRRQEALDVFLQTTPRKSFAAKIAKLARTERGERQLHQVVGVLERYAAVDDAARTALARLANHRLTSVRALASLVAANPENRIALYSTLLKRAKRDADESVRLSAILGLAKIGDDRALATLDRAKRNTKRDTATRAALDLATSALRGRATAKELDESVRTLRAALDLTGGDRERDTAPRIGRRQTGRDR